MLGKFNFSRHFVKSIVTKERNEATQQEQMNEQINRAVKLWRLPK